jgi:hypothetical protein
MYCQLRVLFDDNAQSTETWSAPGPQTGIIRVDLKDNPFDNLAGLVLIYELLGRTHYDAAIDCLPAGSISPSKLPYTLSVPPLRLYKASILHVAPFCTSAWLASPGR